jgi:Zn-finger protein
MKNGVKSCINCLRPHRPDSFSQINGILKQHI